MVWKTSNKYKDDNKGSQAIEVSGVWIYENEICANCGEIFGDHYGYDCLIDLNEED